MLNDKSFKINNNNFVSSDDVISVTPELYFSRRDKNVLVVELESASWGVLSKHYWLMYRRISHGRETNDPWGYWKTFKNHSRSVKVKDINYEDIMPHKDFVNFLHFLYERNFIAINGVTSYEPELLWKVQKYPHYINIHMTEGCNLACHYCLINAAKSSPKMSMELAEKIVYRVLTEIPGDSFNFGPHGGEPLLNFETVLHIAKVSQEMGKALDKSTCVTMQTNGVLLQRVDYCKALFDAGVTMGVSLDGPRDIHNKNRVFHNQNGTFDEVIKGIQTARSVGHKLGFISVIYNPENYIKVLDFLVKELQAYEVRLNYLSKEGRAKDSLQFSLERADVFARHWLEMVDYALKFHKESGVWLDIDDLNLFIYHLISKERPHMCYRSPCGIGNSILGISPDGNIYLCDELVGNDSYKIGNINDPINLKALLDTSKIMINANQERKLENIHKCNNCAWKRFHGGPCTSKTVAYYGRLQDDPMCRFYHVVFEGLMWKMYEHPEMTALIGRYKENLNYSQNNEVAIAT